MLTADLQELYTLLQNGRRFSALLFTSLIGPSSLVLKLEMQKNIFP